MLHKPNIMKTFTEKIDEIREKAIEFIKSTVKVRGEIVIWDGVDDDNFQSNIMGLGILYLDKHQGANYYFPTKVISDGDIEAITTETGEDYTFTLYELQTEEICGIADYLKNH